MSEENKVDKVQEEKSKLKSERASAQPKAKVKKEETEVNVEAEKAAAQKEHEAMLAEQQKARDEYNKGKTVEQTEAPKLKAAKRDEDKNAQTFAHLPSAHDTHFDSKIIHTHKDLVNPGLKVAAKVAEKTVEEK